MKHEGVDLGRSCNQPEADGGCVRSEAGWGAANWCCLWRCWWRSRERHSTECGSLCLTAELPSSISVCRQVSNWLRFCSRPQAGLCLLVITAPYSTLHHPTTPYSTLYPLQNPTAPPAPYITLQHPSAPDITNSVHIPNQGCVC